MSILNQFVSNKPSSWHLYFISALLLDTISGAAISNHAWLYAGFLVMVLVYVTARRFIEIGWFRYWAVLYAFFTLSPYSILCFYSHTNVRLITPVIVILQIPAMIWPRRKTVKSIEENNTTQP